MECLVPLNTTPPGTGTPAGAFTITQNLASGVMSATFDLSSYGFAMPPRMIIPSIVTSSGTESNLSLFPQMWTSTSFTVNFSAPTPDSTYILQILVIP